VGKLESFTRQNTGMRLFLGTLNLQLAVPYSLPAPCENMIEIATDIRLRDAYDLQDGDEVEVHLV
jgi:riboflavin kinase, archaea type